MRKRFTEEQIVKILQEHAEGKTVGEVCRNNGISENTLYIWKRRYGGMQVSDVIKLKTLQYKNTNSNRESMLRIKVASATGQYVE